MKKNQSIALLSVVLFFLSCASVKIYSDESMQHPAALKFHYAKPYVLVEKAANKDGTDKISIIYLPDLTETFYAKSNAGIGSADLKIAFENGAIASFGLSTDNKIPESLAPIKTVVAELNKLSLPNKITDKAEAGFELYAIDNAAGKMILRKLEWGEIN